MKKRIGISQNFRKEKAIVHKSSKTVTFWKSLACLAVCAAILLLVSFVTCLMTLHKKSVPQKETEEVIQETENDGTKLAEQEIVLQDVIFPHVHGDREFNIHATISVPESEDSIPLVVMCHGFTGNRKGDGHFPAMAQLLGQQGIATIALDFPGCGENAEESLTEYTLENIESDIDAAIQYMAQEYSVDLSRVGLLGHSMGGRAVALHLDESIAAAAMWSPAANEGLDGLEFLYHDGEERETMRQTALAEGFVPLHDWGDQVISSAFIEQMAQSSPWDRIRSYSGPLLISFSAGDVELLSQSTIDGTIKAALDRQINFVNLYGQFFDATHNYNAVSGEDRDNDEIHARLEEQTAHFFAEALVQKVQHKENDTGSSEPVFVQPADPPQLEEKTEANNPSVNDQPQEEPIEEQQEGTQTGEAMSSISFEESNTE